MRLIKENRQINELNNIAQQVAPVLNNGVMLAGIGAAIYAVYAVLRVVSRVMKTAASLIHLMGSLPYAGIVLSTAMIGFGVGDCGPTIVNSRTLAEYMIYSAPESRRPEVSQTVANTEKENPGLLTKSPEQQQRQVDKLLPPACNGIVIGGGVGLLACSIIVLSCRLYKYTNE